MSDFKKRAFLNHFTYTVFDLVVFIEDSFDFSAY